MSMKNMFRPITSLAAVVFIFLPVLCFLPDPASASYNQTSKYPNGCTIEDASGTVHYPDGRVAKNTYGTIYYSNGRTARDSYGTIYYPNGFNLKNSYGTIYYPNGRTLLNSYGVVYYENGQTARNSYGHTYYDNGFSAGGPVTITVDLGQGCGAFKFRVTQHSCNGFLLIALGYQFYLCLDIDLGDCSIEQL